MSSAPAVAPPAAKYFWHPRIKLVSVESGIAGGKSTVLRRMEALVPLHSKSRAWFVQEPVKIWEDTGALAQFYDDPPRYAAEFQALTFSTRIGALGAAYHEAHEYVEASAGALAIIVTERSPFTDRDVFERLHKLAGNITKAQHAAYKAKFDAWQRLMQGRGYDLYIWLDTPVDESQRRFSKRARPGEAVPDAYAQALYARHTELLTQKQYRGAPVITVNGMSELHTCDKTLLSVWDRLKGACAPLEPPATQQ